MEYSIPKILQDWGSQLHHVYFSVGKVLPSRFPPLKVGYLTHLGPCFLLPQEQRPNLLFVFRRNWCKKFGWNHNFKLYSYLSQRRFSNLITDQWPVYTVYTGDWRVAYLKSTSPRRYTQVRVHTSICSSKSITKTPKIWFKKSKVISWSLQGNSAELPPYKPRSMRVQVNCMLWGMCYSESQMKHDFMAHGSGKC